MNFYSPEIKSKSKKKKQVNTRQNFSYSLILKLVCGLLVIFLIMNYWIGLRAKTEILNRKAIQIQQRTEVLKKEIMHLKIEKERLSSWKHINRKICHFRLPLIYPEPFQVKKLYMVARKSKPATGLRQLGAEEDSDIQVSANH